MKQSLISLTCPALLLITQAVSAQDISAIRAQANTFFKPLPASMPGSENDSAEKVALGEKLHFETALSVNITKSCNSCHFLDRGKKAGVDVLRVSPGGIAGKEGVRKSPTVWDAGFHFARCWDGRAAGLKEQAEGPVLDPVEMAMPDEG